MIERKKLEMNVARQYFKNNNQIFFRIYATKHKFPIQISPNSNWPIYELIIDTKPPFGCWVNGRFVREFPSWKEAWVILQERVNTMSRQFGFERYFLWRWA